MLNGDQMNEDGQKWDYKVRLMMERTETNRRCLKRCLV